MSKSVVNSVPYLFPCNTAVVENPSNTGLTEDISSFVKDVRGLISSIQASQIRTVMLETHRFPTKILAHC